MELMTNMRSKMQMMNPAASSTMSIDSLQHTLGKMENNNSNSSIKNNNSYTQENNLRFPGNKVMQPEGLAEKKEGMYVDVTPGFVMKTMELHSNTKVLCIYHQTR
jgi:hypothetical protein